MLQLLIKSSRKLHLLTIIFTLTLVSLSLQEQQRSNEQLQIVHFVRGNQEENFAEGDIISRSGEEESNETVTEEGPKWGEEEQGEEYQQPEPPHSLRVQLNEDGGSEPTATFIWELPQSKKLTGLQVTLELLPAEELAGEGPVTFAVDGDTTHFTTDKVQYPLEAGRTYRVGVKGAWHTHWSPPISTNFTIRPNPLDRFVVWYRNESSFLVLWQPPNSGYFQKYKAEITPREAQESTLHVTRWEYQYGGVRPGFFFLTPGRAYNISVVAESEGVESSPVVKEYRTMPLRVSNVTVAVKEYKNVPKVVVDWVVPPGDEGEYDGFNVYIKREWGKPVQKFVSRKKPPRAHLDDSGLVEGEEYQVVVKTVAGKVSSHPVSSSFLFAVSNNSTTV